jgi:acyl transferase domain-containing protein/acyl carrier protein
VDRRTVDPDVQSVAIIGMAARFPGAPDIETFWENLRNGVESVTFFSDEELEADGVGKTTLADPNYVKACATIPDIDLFDADYFNYSPKEAEFIDPQQRIFLECALHALESAGYDPAKYSGSIGVFAGTAINTYQISLIAAHQQEIRTSGALRALFINGNDKDHLTTRTSYKLHLRGPSMAVQTACSTSLVAVHVACQSVLSGECDMALAGGVSVLRGLRRAGYYFVDGGIQSPDGHCRPFDVAARGTIFGDGAGIVVLKRLEQALADNDKIHAVIRGSAINNDGSEKVGYTAPSVNGQAAVIAEALAVAGLDPNSISYVETHGTGTELGDPIEIAALSEVYRARTQTTPCAIGSAKGNIGHLNTAAGIAGLIKTVLALKHGYLPPSLNFKQPNPKIDFSNTPFYVNSRLATWQDQGGPRRAGVSSFGIGGTNAHVVLEEAPTSPTVPSQRAWHVLLLSGRTPNVLEAATNNLRNHLLRSDDNNIADVAYTLSAGRKIHRYGRAVVCRNIPEAIDLLEARGPQRVFSGERSIQDKPVVFMFPGQGSQRLNMGRELYQDEPLFRREIDHCSELLRNNMRMDLRQLLFPPAEDEMDATARITETEFAQPAIFAVSFALAKLWMSWGVTPHAMIGHSIGELVAACLAGVFTLADALAVVSARGRLMQEMPRGAMLGVGASVADLTPFLKNGLSIAAINAPNSCVISGPLDAVAEAELALQRDRIPASRLRTSHAFHSALMAPAVGPFVKALEALRLQSPSIPFVSNVTGKWITPQEATDPSYWGKQLLQTVRFAEGVRTLTERQTLLLEVGVGRTLTTLAASNTTDPAKVGILASLPFSGGKGSEMESIMQAAAQLWLAGVPVEWPILYRGEERMRVPLPPYPFERKRYWIESRDTVAEKTPSRPIAANLNDPFYVRSWRRALRESPEWKAEHLAKTNWLIFAGEDSLSRELAEALLPRCRNLTVVKVGADFAERDDLGFTLSPAEPGQFQALISRLKLTDRSPDIIVYLWSMLPRRSALSGLEEAVDRAFSGPLHLLQAVEHAELGKRVELATVVTNTEDVLGGEVLRPLGAVARGPCHVGNLECENVRCRYVDISIEECNAAGRPRIIDQLIRDLASPAPDVIVAYRRYRAWTAQREHAKLDVVEPGSILRQGGVYLITGGMGAIGLELGRALAERAKAKLVLVGRTGLPDRDRWDRHLSEADAADRVANIIRGIRAIEETGSEVMIATADVTNLSTMRTVVKQVQTRFGAINGVIHAAGIGSGKPIAYTTRPACLKVLKPKIQGTLVLDRIFDGLDIDFLVLFSSISTQQGYLGQVDYSAANSFLDAFAWSKSSARVGRTISINWDLWSEIGMFARRQLPEKLRGAHAAELEYGIKTTEAIDAFFRILRSGLPQVLVSMRQNLEPGRDTVGTAGFAEGAHPPQEIARVESKTVATALRTDRGYPRPDLREQYVAPGTELEQIIADMWAESLSLESVGINDDFFELGGHSLLALQLLPRLRNRFQVELTPRDFFAASTVAGVSQVVEEKLIAEIEQMDEEEVAEVSEH